MSSKNQNWIAISFIAICLTGVLISPVLIGSDLIAFPRTPELALPLMMVLGIVAMVAVIALLTTIISALGLGNNRFAFGLPEGSVRAVIALGLLMIFVSLSVYLMGEIDKQGFRSTNLNETQLTYLQESSPGSIVALNCSQDEASLCQATILVDRSQESRDLAKQILTSLITLLAAVSSFYFGSRASSSYSHPFEPKPDSTVPLDEPSPIP